MQVGDRFLTRPVADLGLIAPSDAVEESTAGVAGICSLGVSTEACRESESRLDWGYGKAKEMTGESVDRKSSRQMIHIGRGK